MEFISGKGRGGKYWEHLAGQLAGMHRASTKGLVSNGTYGFDTDNYIVGSDARTIKYTVRAQDPVTAKIGRNILPESDYTVVYHIGSSKNGKEIRNPLAKRTARQSLW